MFIIKQNVEPVPIPVPIDCLLQELFCYVKKSSQVITPAYPCVMRV